MFLKKIVQFGCLTQVHEVPIKKCMLHSFNALSTCLLIHYNTHILKVYSVVITTPMQSAAKKANEFSTYTHARGFWVRLLMLSKIILTQNMGKV